MRNNGKNGNVGKGNNMKNKKKTLPNLSPQQLAVVVGILTNALDVESVLVDRDQKVEILLIGTLRRKTKADRIAEELGDMSVGDLIQAFIRK